MKTTLALLLALAVTSANAAYVRDSSGTVVTNNYGECWTDSAGLADETDKAAMIACGDAVAEKSLTKEIISSNGDWVNFAFDSAEITAEEAADIATLMKAINELDPKEVLIVLTGHADAVGTPEYNLDLGMRRAEAVAAILRNNGFVVDTETAGETQLLVDTAAAERRNRRVEFEAYLVR